MPDLITGATPAQEWIRQERLRNWLALHYGRRWRAEIEQGMRQMLAQIEASNGAAPPMPDTLAGNIGGVYREAATASIRAFGVRILEPGKASGIAIETKDFAEFFQRMADEYLTLEGVRRRITAVAETTRDQMVRLLLRGQEDGEPLDTIARNMTRTIPRLSRARAALIARTEIHGAANYGAHQAAKATGLQIKKRWIAVHDHRTRDFREPDIADFSHRQADGQIVEMDQPFRIPGLFGSTEPLMFPGDPSGSPGNTINCRCALGHVVED